VDLDIGHDGVYSGDSSLSEEGSQGKIKEKKNAGQVEGEREIGAGVAGRKPRLNVVTS